MALVEELHSQPKRVSTCMQKAFFSCQDKKDNEGVVDGYCKMGRVFRLIKLLNLT